MYNDANVVCFGERTQTPELILSLAKTWITTEFEGERHSDRLDKIHKLEGGC